MSNRGSVKVVKDNGSKLQWAKGWFYRQEGEKLRLNPKALKVTSIVSFLLIVGSSFMYSTDPGRYKEVQPDAQAGLAESAKIKLLSFLETSKKEQKKKAEQQRKERQKRFKAIKVSRIAPISRPGLDKIPPGSEVKAELLTGASDGVVKARLLDDLEVGGEIYLPMNSILLGQGASGDERLLVGFHTAVFEDGRSQKVSAVACDVKTKIAGLTGAKLGRKALKMAMATGLHVLAGVSQGFQETQLQQGVAVPRPSFKNAMLNGAATGALESGRELMEDTKSKTEQIYVKAGTKVLIVFNGGAQ